MLDEALFLSARAPKFRFILTIDTGATVLSLCTALTITTPTPFSGPGYIVENVSVHKLHLKYDSPLVPLHTCFNHWNSTSTFDRLGTIDNHFKYSVVGQ